jgi:hypothetical protein
MDRSDDRLSTNISSSWIQTTLYELIDIIGAGGGANEVDRIAGIMLNLGNTRRLRPSRRWARIKFVSPVEKSPVVAGSIAATDLGGNLDEQDAIPAQRGSLFKDTVDGHPRIKIGRLVAGKLRAKCHGFYFEVGKRASTGRTGGIWMINNIELTEAGRQYAAAYEIHYGSKNLRKAFELYKKILTDHPDTKEAGYAKSQIQNIVNTIVPKEERLDSQMDLAAAIFENVKD